jgi:hypothetical protein
VFQRYYAAAVPVFYQSESARISVFKYIYRNYDSSIEKFRSFTPIQIDMMYVLSQQLMSNSKNLIPIWPKDILNVRYKPEYFPTINRITGEIKLKTLEVPTEGEVIFKLVLDEIKNYDLAMDEYKQKIEEKIKISRQDEKIKSELGIGIDKIQEYIDPYESKKKKSKSKLTAKQCYQILAKFVYDKGCDIVRYDGTIQLLTDDVVIGKITMNEAIEILWDIMINHDTDLFTEDCTDEDEDTDDMLFIFYHTKKKKTKTQKNKNKNKNKNKKIGKPKRKRKKKRKK